MAFKKIGSLWIKTSEKTGQKFLSGVVKVPGSEEEISITVWKNDKGDNPKRPDYTIQAQVEDVAPPPADDSDANEDMPF